jgi:putative FmdB family regulatory protein
MPVYEYACDACEHNFEVWQSIKEPRLTRCPACQADRARRLISTTTFALKGSGWYVTDYATRKPKSATEGKDS